MLRTAPCEGIANEPWLRAVSVCVEAPNSRELYGDRLKRDCEIHETGITAQRATGQVDPEEPFMGTCVDQGAAGSGGGREPRAG